MVFTKDIYVGTVPLCMKDMKSCVAGMFNQPYLNSSEELLGGVSGGGSSGGGQGTGSQLSLTEILAAAVTAASAANPSAPCLTILEPLEVSLDTENHLAAAAEDRPPPFAPGHEELPPESPSAPSAQMLLCPWTEDGQSEILVSCCCLSFDLKMVHKDFIVENIVELVFTLKFMLLENVITDGAMLLKEFVGHLITIAFLY